MDDIQVLGPEHAECVAGYGLLREELAKREAELVVSEAHAEARSVTRAAAAERERLLAEARKVRALLEAALDAVDDAQADDVQAA